MTRLTQRSAQRLRFSLLSVCLALLSATLVVGPLARAWLGDDDDLEDLPPANEGAFEGGPTGSFEDAGLENAIPEDDLRKGGGFNVPTDGRPSPLFGAEPFTQAMLRFEEFGTEPIPDTFVQGRAFPSPDDARSSPDGDELDAFLRQDIYPAPMREANDLDANPWKTAIEAFLGRQLDSPPAEGRPPGEGWAHQRYGEFPPQVWFQSAQAGARSNGGLRDRRQRHGGRRRQAPLHTAQSHRHV